MFKLSIVCFFAVAVFCIGASVSNNNKVLLGKLQGPGSKRLVLDNDIFDFKMDYSGTHAFYNTTDKLQLQYYTLDMGGCKLEFYVGPSGFTEYNNRAHNVKIEVDPFWPDFYDDFPFGTVNSTSITFNFYVKFSILNGNQSYSCTPQFDRSSVPGKYVIDVSLSGADVAPDLIVNFYKVDVPTTTLAPTAAPVKPMLEVWQIVLIAGIILLASIGLCIVVICCYRNKKAKDKKVFESEHSIATMGTTVGAFTTRETDLYGPNSMHFSKNITESGPNAANSQAVSPAPQVISPAPATSPMQPAK